MYAQHLQLGPPVTTCKITTSCFTQSHDQISIRWGAMVTPQVIMTTAIRPLQSQNRGRTTNCQSVVAAVVFNFLAQAQRDVLQNTKSLERVCPMWNDLLL